MHRYFLIAGLSFCLLSQVSFAASGYVAQFGDASNRKLTVIASQAQGLNRPRDVKFNPDAAEQLWVVNQTDDSVVIVKDPGTSTQSFDKRIDRYANHFMEEVSSLAFGDRTFENSMTFATCQESRNTYNNTQRPNDFMGPTLWPADLDVFARVNQNNRLGGSHIDMNHQSPLCMGIAHQSGNKYWVFDGKNGHVVFYDFQKDHGPGETDHSDAIVRRYTEVKLTRKEGIPGHMAFDAEKKWLYIADTGAKRVVRVDVTTGTLFKRLRPTNEPLEEYSEYRSVTHENFVTEGLQDPSGLAIFEGKLFVSDHATGSVAAYDLVSGAKLDSMETGSPGIMGLTVGVDGKLWYVNGLKNTLVRVDP